MKLSLNKIDELYYTLVLVSMQIRLSLVKPETSGSTWLSFNVCLRLAMHSAFNQCRRQGDSWCSLAGCVTSCYGEFVC